MNEKPIISGLTTVIIAIIPTKAQFCKGTIKPNIVFILADDLGWKELGCYGGVFYETSYIDQLAREGVSFTNAYASCLVSSPIWASIQTGKYLARIHVTDDIAGGYSMPSRKKIIDSTCPILPVAFEQNIPLSELIIVEALKQEGYQTAHIGKWNCATDSLIYPQYQGYDTNIEGCNKRGAFFINLPFYQVRTSLLAKADKVRCFEEKAQRMGINSSKIFNIIQEWKSKQPFQDSTHIERIIQSNAAYAAMISGMDENIGRIINELKCLGLYENTIIIFTSGNRSLSTSEGSPTINIPLRGGKSFTYEGETTESLSVRMSHMKNAGSKLPPEQRLGGISFFPLLKNEKQSYCDAIYWHSPHYSNQWGRPSGAIQMGNYKLL